MLPADSPAEHAPAMVAACSQALVEGRCALARELPESAHPQAVALVLWHGEALLEVTVRVGQGDGKWVSRHLTFTESDSISDRFTTVGLTAAALVDDTLPKPAAPQVGTAPPIARDTSAKVATAEQEPHRRRVTLRAQIGALTGPGWAGAGWQRGAWATVGVRLPRLPVLIYGAGSYAVSAGPSVAGADLDSTWLTLALGGGVTAETSGVSASLSAEVGARRVSAELSGRSATDWDAPVRVRALLTYPNDGPAALAVGGLLRLPPGGGDGSETHARPGFAAELLLGLEVRF